MRIRTNFMNTLTRNIEAWGLDRGLLDQDPVPQTVKLMEEVGELAEGIIKQRPEQIKDSIGDAVVVLTILAQQCGLSLNDCVEHAYQEIKNRKGKMVDGIFVKEEDIQPEAVGDPQ